MNTRLVARHWTRTNRVVSNEQGEHAIVYEAEGNAMIVYPDGTFDRKDRGRLMLRAGYVDRDEAEREYQRRLNAKTINVEQVAYALLHYINGDLRQKA